MQIYVLDEYKSDLTNLIQNAIDTSPYNKISFIGKYTDARMI